jgi:hypothetical protein
MEREWAAEAEVPSQQHKTHLREGAGERVCAGRGSSRGSTVALRKGEEENGKEGGAGWRGVNPCICKS